MNTKLITALRTAANAVENGTFDYKWTSANRCNCGVLFCALTGKSAEDLPVPIVNTSETVDGSWATKVGRLCPVSGVPTNELFRQLFTYGLTAKDIVELEYLDNEEIVKRAGIKTHRRNWYGRTVEDDDYFTNEDNLVLYLRAWADMLQEQGRDDAPSGKSVEQVRAQQNAKV